MKTQEKTPPQDPETTHLFPADKLRWRLARKLEREYEQGGLTVSEYEDEMAALFDTLLGE